MRRSKKTSTPLTLVAMVLLATCAEQRPAINRVQVAALEKAFFVGNDLRDTADDPEFYMRGVVVDVGYGAAQDGLFTSTYAQPVSRIKWEITENTLNARLAYERVQGTDGKGTAMNGLKKKASNDGQLVASYRITSHFDVRRAYNSATGEALNVVEENSSDRPWYERAYMRVDWSQNLSTDTYDFDTLSMMGMYGGISYESIPYAITDEKHPDAPHFDLDKSYFDVTVKAFAKPQMIDLSSLGWGIDKFPACYLPAEFAGGTAPFGNCNPVELTLRTSFRKVVDNDYEPMDWDGIRFQAHGLFTQDYYGYDRKYGMVDNKWFRFASRYNLWERSHYYADPETMTGEVACATRGSTVGPTGNPAADPNRDLNPKNGTADECEAVTAATGVGGSRCDTFKGKCTLPTRARKLKTIAWYLNGNTDEDLFEATNWAVQEWDVAMRASLQTARLVECRRAGGSDCDNSFPMWSGQQDDYDDAVQVARTLDACNRRTGWSEGCKGGVDADVQKLATERRKAVTDLNLKGIAAVMKAQPVIVLCHNPVVELDHPSCGAPGLSPRQGDLRYHTVLNIDKPQTPSAWGIMVDADDPISGEKLAASINIWTHVTDLAVQGLADLVRYMNGELSVESITNGKYIHDWVEAEKLGGGTVAALPTMTKDEVAKRLSAATKLDPEAFSRAIQNGLSPEVKERMKGAKHQVLDVAAHADVPSPMQAAIDARLNMARGTPTEAKLINAPMLQLAGVPGGLPVTGTVKQLASPLQLNNPKLLSQLRNVRENALAKRGACILREAPEASALTGIADAMKKKFPAALGENADQARERIEKMIRYLRRRFHYAVIAHEMGHSIGIRHNFVSSYGALHYRPQYWQLRTKNGAITTPCTDATADGATCVGPRYYDPVTTEEQSQLIWMFMQSSVMDYPGDLSQDMIGLGMWDFASARMAYGDTVAVYKNPDLAAGSRIGVGITGVTDTFGGLLGIKYAVAGFQGPDEFHYSQLQKEYGVISDCYPISAQAPAWWREDVDGKWDAVLDGKIVAVDGVYKKCRQMPVDYAAWTDLREPTVQEKGGGYYRGGPSVEKAASARLRVPYHFATDHWADLGNVSAFRHDNGADPYEQAMFLITTQENRHIFDNFRRNRTTFSVRGAADRSFGRYNEKLVNISGGIAFLGNIYKNFATAAGYTWDTLWPSILNDQAKEQVLAASIAFDHLTRQLSRPEDGPHFARAAGFADPVLRSAKDPDGPSGRAVVTVPNGTTGFLRDVGFGGRPIENALSDAHGDYDSRYIENAGSYYDKINSIIHLSISEDRFISQSRGDFVDARQRANGMADIFPDGWRRVIANSLTGDKWAMAPFVAADMASRPLADTNGFPSRPMGWTSWWPGNGPEVCFASNGRNACATVDGSTLNLHPDQPSKMVPLDPEIGWEVQKFIIVWSLGLVLANEHSQWQDMMKLYKLGDNTDPGIPSRIEWQDPVSGTLYFARTYGTECLFGAGTACTGGKIAQKGIAARVVEWANTLTAKAYKLNTTAFPARPGFLAGHNDFGRPMIVRHPDGTPVVMSDPAMKQITPEGGVGTPKPDCDQNVTAGCEQLTKFDNRWAMELEGYKSVPDFLWEVGQVFGIGYPRQLGLYP